MIPNQWYVILESKEVKSGRPIGVTRMGEKLVLWRDAQDKVTCMRDLCPHRGVALSAGKVLGNCVQCPFHGFEFDISGQCTVIPANGKNAPVPKAFKVHTYLTREAHGFIYIWWGEPREDLPALPFFEAIDEAASHTTIRDPWPTHYSRAIENQLDVVHLPFVHRNTIGRGQQTLVNGPRSRLETIDGNVEQLSIWFDNEVDHGQTPLRPDQMPAPQRRELIQFLFPNLWHNWLGEKLHLLIAFVPIDAENSLLYIRNYQSFVRVPIVRNVVDFFSAIGNFVIERQDRRIVITQEPKRSELRMGEKLIPGDNPIIEYRRRRRELIEQAAVPA